MIIVLKQCENQKLYDLIVDTDKIDCLIEYQCRIVINGIYHRITLDSYKRVKNFMEYFKREV